MTEVNADHGGSTAPVTTSTQPQKRKKSKARKILSPEGEAQRAARILEKKQNKYKRKKAKGKEERNAIVHSNTIYIAPGGVQSVEQYLDTPHTWHGRYTRSGKAQKREYHERVDPKDTFLQIDLTPNDSIDEDATNKDKIHKYLVRVEKSLTSSYDCEDDPFRDVDHQSQVQEQIHHLQKGRSIFIRPGGIPKIARPEWEVALEDAGLTERVGRGVMVEVTPSGHGKKSYERPLAEVLELCDTSKPTQAPVSCNSLMRDASLSALEHRFSHVLSELNHSHLARQWAEYHPDPRISNPFVQLRIDELAEGEEYYRSRRMAQRVSAGFLLLSTAGAFTGWAKGADGLVSLRGVANGVELVFLRGLKDRERLYMRVVTAGSGVVIPRTAERFIYSATPTIALSRPFFIYHLLGALPTQDDEGYLETARSMLSNAQEDVLRLACAYTNGSFVGNLAPRHMINTSLYHHIIAALTPLVRQPDIYWPVSAASDPALPQSGASRDRRVLEPIRALAARLWDAMDGGKVGEEVAVMKRQREEQGDDEDDTEVKRQKVKGEVKEEDMDAVDIKVEEDEEHVGAKMPILSEGLKMTKEEAKMKVES